MIKAGGILGIIGGIFGILAALATLFIGGIGSAFQANGASTVVGLGWGGVAFSMFSIVCGAIAFAKPKGAGIALVVTAVTGMIGGGTLVAICMVLSLFGGILSIIGAKKQAPVIATPAKSGHAVASSNSVQADKRKISSWVWGAAGMLFLLVVMGVSSNGKSGPSHATARIDPLDELAKSPVSDIRPDGALAEIFSFGGQHTDLQRENALKGIKGKTISWNLPVYEVKRDGNGYKIQTSSGYMNAYVGAFINISPRNQEDRQIIESLQTGVPVSFRGVISDVFMRHIVIKPAILERQDTAAPIMTAPTSQSVFQTGSAIEDGRFTPR